jgi:hypothetical protein
MAQKIRLEEIKGDEHLLSVGFVSAQVSEDDLWEMLNLIAERLGVEIVQSRDLKQLIGQINGCLGGEKIDMPIMQTSNNNNFGTDELLKSKKVFEDMDSSCGP